MPAVWEQHCYDEGGERRGPAGRQHRQRHGAGDLPRVPRLLPPHRRPGPGGDPIHSRETPIHLITDEQAYKDVRASVMGGLSCIFQPFAQANNPELGEEDYNPEEPVSWISYLDFNAMYLAAMTLPMPNGPCEAVALPEDNAARLS